MSAVPAEWPEQVVIKAASGLLAKISWRAAPKEIVEIRQKKRTACSHEFKRKLLPSRAEDFKPGHAAGEIAKAQWVDRDVTLACN